ncbi:TadE/TadG family type IV pilus assembly protein [Tropicibacter naphthalenivorans]|uniref:Flp pilus assembly protein TadG n=1 Tax=Tropicibacter naphthalenivorans TaxID=441103 RepID=A0A0P1G889_9RHOB|nr:hypothetical protein [Tropicibacter naphthalenivorans]CUH77875.1 hypothetical protein TRN7648_01666 [Tropicibacter naphthalenivorans]SMC95319.1 hypothetical protein SAMN04488093_107175 [Tropicibacter naphthalenivorans]
MLKSILTSRLRAFAKDTRGYVTVEAVIVMPALLWLFGVGWVYFDVFRQQAVNQKANYVIGDMISRETDPIDDTYIDNAFKLLNVMNKSQNGESVMRITVAEYNANNKKWSLEWSEARGGQAPMNNGDLNGMTERLPVAGNSEQLVLVETWDKYDPAFEVGLSEFDITTYSFTRPRYAPQIIFYDPGQNNGWGNGDQDAPGNSLCNNNAENATDCVNDSGQLNIEPSKKGKGN